MTVLLLLLLSIVPKGVVLVKGATPSASDLKTPVPEGGRLADGRYRNAYFGLTFPIPAGWNQQPAGPPPSDAGAYTLAQFTAPKVNVLVSAQDLFFGASPQTSIGRNLPASYVKEDVPPSVEIAGRTFRQLAYRSPASGLRWRVLTTDARCHALTFIFTGTDSTTLTSAESALGSLSLAPPPTACAADYARGENIIAKQDPLLTTHRYNPVPVRIIIGKDGRVQHTHLLSAFPDQASAILAAVSTWRFKPYRVNGRAEAVETGVRFGAR
ncbi:MAG: hypothetical protein JOZ54_20635 [Acidobacteria bacterium]|nr:hypothetical protein [Acidobacteriota bacterium]